MNDNVHDLTADSIANLTKEDRIAAQNAAKENRVTPSKIKEINDSIKKLSNNFRLLTLLVFAFSVVALSTINLSENIMAAALGVISLLASSILNIKIDPLKMQEAAGKKGIAQKGKTLLG